MSWTKLLGDRCVSALPSSKAELDNLRPIVTRSLKDAAAENLSADAQFVMAYDAARTLSLMIVRAEGYRPRSVGAHYNTFLALEAACSRSISAALALPVLRGTGTSLCIETSPDCGGKLRV